MAFNWKKFGKDVRSARNNDTMYCGVRMMADHIGVTPSTLNRIENGHRATVEAVMKICDYIGLAPAEYWKP